MQRALVIGTSMAITDGDQPPPKRRLSITKLQRETEAAIELISLCQTVTEDGSLSHRCRRGEARYADRIPGSRARQSRLLLLVPRPV
jgi:hypothetical protein